MIFHFQPLLKWHEREVQQTCAFRYATNISIFSTTKPSKQHESDKTRMQRTTTTQEQLNKSPDSRSKHIYNQE